VVFQEDILPFKHLHASTNPMFPVVEYAPSASECMPSHTETTDVPPMSSSSSSPHAIPVMSDPMVPVSLPSTTGVPSRRSARSSKPPLWLQDFVTKSKCNTCTYSLANQLSYDHLSPAYRQVLKAYSALTELVSFKEAATDPAWVKAMELEIAALESNKTWSIVDLPPGKKPIGCKWIYKIKFLAS